MSRIKMIEQLVHNNNIIIIGRARPWKCSRSSSYSTSSSTDWQCGDNYCIDQYYVCDGILDCLDGRDEFDCGEC